MDRDSDKDLVEAWRAGDSRAGDKLLQRHHPSLRKFFINKVSEGEREELIQVTLLGCVSSILSFRGDSSFRTFLFTIARRKLIDHYRSKERAPGLEELSETAIAALSTGPFSIVARRREHALLQRALRHVSMADQVVLELYYWEDISANDIAQILDSNEPAVRSHLRRAKARLRSKVEALASSPEEARSTLDGLERWAAEVREHIDGADADDNADDNADDGGSSAA